MTQVIPQLGTGPMSGGKIHQSSFIEDLKLVGCVVVHCQPIFYISFSLVQRISKVYIMDIFIYLNKLIFFCTAKVSVNSISKL